MSVIQVTTPASLDRDPDMICWRVAAIYRCCLRMGMNKDWALKKLREVSPEGHRDHMADLWFANMDDVRAYYFRNGRPQDFTGHKVLEEASGLELAA